MNMKIIKKIMVYDKTIKLVICLFKFDIRVTVLPP